MTIVVIAGPSGVGKTTVVAGVLRALPDLRLASSLTTREPRPDDTAGKYVYVSRPEFENKIHSAEVLEWAEYSGNLYGTLRPGLDEQVLLEIELQGAAQVKQLLPSTQLVFLVPPGKDIGEQLAVLAERLRRRGTDQSAVIQQRLARAEQELQQGQGQADTVVVNDDLTTAVQQTVAYVQEYVTTK
jgi:guanylate kinase